MIDSLKPCPFCNSQAFLSIKNMIVNEDEPERPVYYVYCVSADCEARLGFFIDKQQTIDAWNIRHQPVKVTYFPPSEINIRYEKLLKFVRTIENDPEYCWQIRDLLKEIGESNE